MDNVFTDVQVVKERIVNEIMHELEWMTASKDDRDSDNYWIDQRHNVFAFVQDNGDDDVYIELHYELYKTDYDNQIGDIMVTCTEDASKESLRTEVEAIVNKYLSI